MLLIACPYCGNRPETEFRCGGQAHIARPADPAALTDEQWSGYLFVRENPRGVHAERWNHAHGCGRWFNALRDTVSDRFLETYKMGEKPNQTESTEIGSNPVKSTQAEARA
jgi:sarcosine oxidase subunit delta